MNEDNTYIIRELLAWINSDEGKATAKKLKQTKELHKKTPEISHC